MNPYNTPYTGMYGNNYQQYSQYQVPLNFPPSQQVDAGMIWVQGESGAKAYPVQNGKTVVLFDSESQRFFIKSTDMSGIPQPLRIFEYTETNENETKTPAIDTSMFVTKDELNDAINSLKQHNGNNNNQGRNGNKNGKPSVQ